MKTWFFIDFISNLPLEYLIPLFSYNFIKTFQVNLHRLNGFSLLSNLSFRLQQDLHKVNFLQRFVIWIRIRIEKAADSGSVL